MVDQTTRHLLTVSQHLIAYFSMEIGFKNEIPTYSGGLGILAGDSLKAIADLGVDAVAVTLLSEKGYFYQKFDDNDYQLEVDYEWTVKSLLKKLDVDVTVMIQNRLVHINVWEYELKGVTGNTVKIYFLDTNNENNTESDRRLTSHLYGGDVQYRLQQEIILGIGGVKVLRELGYYPKKYHMNEGHAAFLISELFNELEGISNDQEKQSIIRKLCSFTTHTPVPAGHDAFSRQDVQSYIGDDIAPYILDTVSEGDNFSMTHLAMNFSSYVNAVARKHQEVSLRMFPDAPIDYITNGVHTLTWTNKHLAALFDRHIVDWRRNPLELRNAQKIPLSELDTAHSKAKQDLIDYINTTTNAGLEYDIFTIGFARRATAYKRAHLLFSDIERLKELSRSVGRIQLVFAGKAHPRDTQGKEIIQHIKALAKDLLPSIHMVFLDNYNMFIGQLMTGGVDLWLNTPKRPLEASGTSGMKAACNGVPSLSVPDGWWVEGLIEGVTGWGIGDEIVSEQNQDVLDQKDATDLYDKLERVVLPTFYHDRERYLSVMRNAIAINASYFNTHRMIKQYLVRAYTRNNE